MISGGTDAVHTICPVEIHLNGKKALTESTGSISIRLQHGGQSFESISYNRFISRLEFVGMNGSYFLWRQFFSAISLLP